MTKLKEASVQHFLALDENTRDENNSYLDGFIAGALWLLEQAYAESYPASEYSTSSVVDIKDLKELCQSKKE